MYDLQLFFQRRRRLMTRAIALLAIGLAATVAVLPRADANGAGVPGADPTRVLLSPKPLSSAAFSTFYPVAQY